MQVTAKRMAETLVKQVLNISEPILAANFAANLVKNQILHIQEKTFDEANEYWQNVIEEIIKLNK